jgi:hypothetical protein
MDHLDPFDRETGHAHVIIETPKGCRAKYSYARKLLEKGRSQP